MLGPQLAPLRLEERHELSHGPRAELLSRLPILGLMAAGWRRHDVVLRLSAHRCLILCGRKTLLPGTRFLIAGASVAALLHLTQGGRGGCRAEWSPLGTLALRLQAAHQGVLGALQGQGQGVVAARPCGAAVELGRAPGLRGGNRLQGGTYCRAAGLQLREGTSTTPGGGGSGLHRSRPLLCETPASRCTKLGCSRPTAPLRRARAECGGGGRAGVRPLPVSSVGQRGLRERSSEAAQLGALLFRTHLALLAPQPQLCLAQ
mmetsp:Transcript_19918/g.43385  ORF Transcript_19918/g.43385 Transcript_19918/m.43385 type:complete len:261 (+) Transcript_19918:567-1349(+)